MATVLVADLAVVLAVVLAGAFATAVRGTAISAAVLSTAALTFFAADDFLATFLVAFLATFLAGARVVEELETFLVVISSVYLRAIATRGGIVETAFIGDGADFLQSDSTVHVRQRPLDQLLEIVKAHRAGSP